MDDPNIVLSDYSTVHPIEVYLKIPADGVEVQIPSEFLQNPDRQWKYEQSKAASKWLQLKIKMREVNQTTPVIRGASINYE